ncbi:glycosyltransferase [Azoarcus sp. L1K30]|uniref:glycosyltransferase n=1 Tax=Azoarcus sp. L1K30 TaxID=2820277 RepID=UPI002011B26B|nr:glycosyltransferase [Azoarcus sp. L1K30]
MIVRNESAVIDRCLASVKDHIDYWVIVDTGSTDDTPAKIQATLKGIPGELHHRKWVDFGHNRTEAIELARGKADYILIMDADNIFHAPREGWHWPALTVDAYDLLIRSANTEYRLRLLVADRLAWRWVGVLHEYLVSTPESVSSELQGPWVDRRHEGARSRDPLTYRKDAAILAAALKKEPGNTRYAFYLAQSWRDAKEPKKALEAYRHRAAMGGWDEEVFFSLYQCGVLLESMKRWPEALDAYLKAWSFRKHRIEPLYRICCYYRACSDFGLGYLFGRRALETGCRTSDRLFVEVETFNWRLADEVSICAFYEGRYQESYDLCSDILRRSDLTETDRVRIEKNREYSAPHVPQGTGAYPEHIVHALASRTEQDGDVTFTITSCRRLDLFKVTVNSFLNCCEDVDRIRRWICIDDGSSEADRAEMARLYPFFEFVLKDASEKGHARSMNMLLDRIDTPYWLALEDDWQFVVKDRFFARMLAILHDDPAIAQVLFNRNYGLIPAHITLTGGESRTISQDGSRYVMHEYVPPESFDAYLKAMPPGSRTNAWWPNYSLHPSLSLVDKIRSIGRYDEGGGHFEKEFADRFTAMGFRTAFLDSINVHHIGKQPWESGSEKKNAYELNQVKQF